MPLFEFINMFNEWDTFIIIAPTTAGTTVNLEINKTCFDGGIYTPEFLTAPVNFVSKDGDRVVITLKS